MIVAGGGAPVALDGDGTLRGVEAAIDENLTAGSMQPKVEAACRFAATTGRRAAIGALTDPVRAARGEAGTQVLAPGGEPASGAARRLPRR